MVGGGGKNWGKLCLWILKDTIPQKLYIFLKGKQKSCLFKKKYIHKSQRPRRATTHH